jgi:hypothetical protein
MKKLSVFLLLATLLSGCSQAWLDARKDHKLTTLAVERKSTFLALSDELNPCFQGKAKSDTTVVFGLRDTMIVQGDTVTTVTHDTIVRTIHLPGKIITQPIQTTIHDTVQDGRAIATLSDQVSTSKDALIKSQQQLADQKSTSTLYHWLFYGLLAFDVIYFGIKIYTGITGIAKKIV